MDKMVINQLPSETLRGNRVFVRLDAASEPSSSSELFDESKLRSSLPTLEYLMGVGARTIIGTHLWETERQSGGVAQTRSTGWTTDGTAWPARAEARRSYWA